MASDMYHDPATLAEWILGTLAVLAFAGLLGMWVSDLIKARRIRRERLAERVSHRVTVPESAAHGVD